MPPIPPWIQAADPATHLAQGMHIGVQLGAQQAEERFRQQQMAARAAQQQQEMDAQAAALRFKEVQAAKNEQMTARDQALAEERFNLAASEVARKHQAFQQYQSAITGGMDPNEAMLQFGPAMAANTGAAAAIRAHERESRTPIVPNEVTLPSGLRGVQMGQRFQFEPSTHSGTAAHVPEGAQYIPATDTVPAHWQNPGRDRTTLTNNEMLLEWHRLDKQMDDLRKAVTFDISPDSTEPSGSTLTKSKWKTAKAKMVALQKRQSDIDSRLNATPATPAAPATGAQTPASKAARANALRAAHPDWSRDQILQAVESGS